MPSLPPLVEAGPPLTAAQVRRWSRHLLLPELGDAAQRRLRNARVCVVGAGGLGSPVLLYLAAAGVGRLGVVDLDTVEVSNLQRQVVHGAADVGRAKVESAADAVRALDPDVDVVAHHLRLTTENVDSILAGYDVVVDGTDNFPTRYLVNDACVRLGLPEVWGSVLRFDAQVSVFWGRPPRGSGVAPVELRDVFPEPPAPGSVPSCAEAGVLGALCGQVGSLMATEVVKLVTGTGEPLVGRVLVVDALRARWTEVPLVGAAGAPAAATPAVASPGAAAPITASSEVALPAAPPPPADEVAPPDGVPEITAAELEHALASGEVVLLDVREAAEREVSVIPAAVHVPLGQVLDGVGLEGVPTGARVVVHCQSGARSGVAVRALRAAGRTDVVHLAGGIAAWSEHQRSGR